MLHIVDSFGRIGEENAFAVLARATELQRQGKDIINLGIGQPDFSTPDHIVEAAIKALRDGHHGYTPATGILPLREAVAADATTKDWASSTATCCSVVAASTGPDEAAPRSRPVWPALGPKSASWTWKNSR